MPILTNRESRSGFTSWWRVAVIAALLQFLCLIAHGAITGFTPSFGQPGTLVTVNGSGFTGATNFLFNGATYADFTIVNSSQMQVVVPNGATTGPLSVVVNGSQFSSTSNFTVAPIITSFTPTTGTYPALVTVFGANFVNGATTVTFTGASPVSGTVTSIGGDQVQVTVPTNAVDGPLTVTVTNKNLSAVSTNDFIVSSILNITSFTPVFATNGSTITVFGDNFVPGNTTVKFGSITSLVVSVVATTELQALVPTNAISAPITILTPTNNSATTTSNFLTGSNPFITDFSPTLGPAATSVMIDGYNLSPSVTGVQFGGITVPSSKFTVWNTTQIQVAVPTGASNAPITVLSPKGNNTTSSNFLSSSGPVITGFSPTGGQIGTTQVTITGFNLSTVKTVKFGSASVAITPTQDNQLQLNVPSGATSGPIEISSTLASFTTSTNFTVTGDVPVITGFSPNTGGPGTPVTITGSFTAVPTTGGVSFNGTAAASAPFTSYNQVQTTVPAGATAGPITVTESAGGKASSTAVFYAQPWITNFSPASAVANTVVTFFGRSLTNATTLTVGGVNWNFTGTDTQILAVVPSNALSGTITVTTPGGVFITPGNFNVLPNIYTFSPLAGPTNTLVTINGTSLSNVTNVEFNGASAKPVLVTNTQVQVRVPSNATTGPISVFTPSGSSVSTNAFVVTQPSLVVLTKTASGELFRPGSNVTYTLTVTNEGPSIVTGLTVNDILPAPLGYVSSSSTLGTISVSGSSITCNVGTLTNNTGLSITIVATATAIGQDINTATLNFIEGNLNPADNTASATVYYLTPASQTLNIKASTPPTNVIISWTNSGIPFQLQSTTNLALPSAWQTINPPTVIVTNQIYTTNATTNASAIFRLIAP